jgi:hypothetical protein
LHFTDDRFAWHSTHTRDVVTEVFIHPHWQLKRCALLKFESTVQSRLKIWGGPAMTVLLRIPWTPWGLVWLLLYAHRHRSMLGVAGHIRTPANQLRLWGSKYGYCPIRVSNHWPFDHWSNVLTTALTGHTNPMNKIIFIWKRDYSHWCMISLHLQVR